MKIEVLGKNGFEPSVANKEYAIKKLDKLNKLIEDSNNTNCRVVCKVYNTFHKVEVTIPAKGFILRAEDKDVDIYAAIDRVVDKLVKQVTKHNDKVKDKMGKKGIRYAEDEDSDKKVVREKRVALEPMTKDEALDQMELLGHDFFVYLDKETKKTNIIYLREDGDYAIIETEAK